MCSVVAINNIAVCKLQSTAGSILAEKHRYQTPVRLIISWNFVDMHHNHLQDKRQRGHRTEGYERAKMVEKEVMDRMACHP